MRAASPFCARNSRYAREVVAKPPGTRTPAPLSWLISSPREAFLPPTSATSFMRNAAKSRTKGVLLMRATCELCEMSKQDILPE
jgi:hypothetical protein